MKMAGIWIGTFSFVVMTSLPLVIPGESDPNAWDYGPNSDIILITDDPNGIIWDIPDTDTYSLTINSYEVDLEFEPLPVDPNHPYFRPYRLTDDSIRRLAKSGQICRVMGHQWKMNMYDYLVTIGEHTTGTQSRTCTLCGIKQTQHYIEAHWSEWK